MSTRLTSTGRSPSLNLQRVESLLTSYFSESAPSVADLAGQFEVTQATVRKYLKMALGGLPRGRAANLARPAQDVQALLENIDTETLLGVGRVKLLLRRASAGASVSELAQQFELTEARVEALVRAHTASEASVDPAQPASAEPVAEQ